MSFKIGCQTYTWEMLGESWKSHLDDILDIISGVGFEGVEISNNMIGHYFGKPEELKKVLSRKNLQLSAFAYSSSYGFSNPNYWDREMEGVKKAIDFLTFFPGSILSLGGASISENLTREEGLLNACRFYQGVGRLCKEKGITLTVHPHSHHGSLIETEEEYQTLMTLTNSQFVKWNPDTGHIIRGGQDLIKCLSRYKTRIAHIHFKDVNKEGTWTPLGKGICNFSEVISLLKETDYSGWIILEEESELARERAKEVIAEDLRVLQSLI